MTTWTCPPGVTKVLVEGWGPGGSGAGSAFPSQTSGGGGGGAYGRSAGIPVTSGNSYLVQWTLGSTSTIFGDGAHLNIDRGGSGGLHNSGPGHGGNGGLASSSVADTKYDGGGGAWYGPLFPNRLPGGGGGGAGGRNGPGNDASLDAGGLGNDPAPYGEGGNGSAGSDSPPPGGPGNTPGGGGGAAGSSAGTTAAGGAGADGAIAIYDDTSGAGWAGVLAGTSPLLAAFGNVPPLPAPPVTARRAAFIM